MPVLHWMQCQPVSVKLHLLPKAILRGGCCGTTLNPPPSKALLTPVCPAARSVGWVLLQELSCWRDNQSYAPPSPASTSWSTWGFKGLAPMPQGINWGFFCTASQVHFSLCPVLFSSPVTPLDSETTPPKSPYTQTSESLSLFPGNLT